MDSDTSDLEDDGLSSDEEGDSGDESDAEVATPGLLTAPPQAGSVSTAPSLPTIAASPLPGKAPSTPGFIPRMLTPRLFSSSGSSSATAVPPVTDYLSAKPIPSTTPSRSSSLGGETPGAQRKKRKFKRRVKDNEYAFSAGKDILGIVMLEIAGAEDLPKLKSSEANLLPNYDI